MPSKDQIRQFLQNLLEIKRYDKEIKIYNNCLVKGKVVRKPSNLNLCTNENCKDCRRFNILLREQYQKQMNNESDSNVKRQEKRNGDDSKESIQEDNEGV